MRLAMGFAIILLAIVIVLQGQQEVMRTPELFGDAHYVSIGIGGYFAGFLWNDGVVFSITGTMNSGVVQGELRQLAGQTVLNEDGSVPGPTPFYCQQRTGVKFFGSINFRGHDRKFCGASAFDQLPCR